MALVVKDRVKETSTSTGTGSFTLSGAVAGFQTFASTLTNGDTTYYAITDAGTGDFEVGLGTYNSGVLSRDTVLETHNGLALVDFNAGEKEVFITYPADKAVYLDADGKVAPTTALMDTIKANDGAGSGLNADLLDGLQASDFVLKAGDTVAGDLTISGDLTVNGTTTTVNATNLAIADNMIYMNDGSTVTNPDLGWSGNYNDGTYAHAGFFRDATDGRFKAYDGYTPEPDASPYIDTSHASFSLADIEANTFYGNLTGTATNANKWTTARTITLGGDLTGSVSIDGTANVVLTAAINDDSHFHVISNIDGLQAALDAKADDTTLISAGTGLTGGGDLSVNRTLELDVSYTDSRYVNTTGDTMTGDLSFGDNNKAIFGAGNDLQIYHDGSHSYIKDVGTGNIIVNGGDFRVNSADNTANMITANSGGAVGLFYAGATKLATTSTGVDVTGNITLSGTVDGVDVAAFKTSYDSHNHDDRYYTESEINTKLTDGSVTKFTPSSTDTFTGVYPVLWHNGSTIPYTSTWFTINGATDTLNVPNINLSGNVTVGGTVDGRDVAADGTKLDGIEAGATADQTAAEILTAIKTVDGSGSGLDADTLDGYDSNRFFRRQAKANATVGPGWMTVAATQSSRFSGEVIVTDGDSGDHAYIRLHWLRSYADSAFSVINCGGHANRITGARVLYQTSDTTYGWKYLQVYVEANSNYEVNIYELGDIADYGCPSVVTPVIEDTKAGYAVHGNEITGLDLYNSATEEGFIAGGEIRSNTGFSVNGSTVFHDGYHPNADKLTTARNIALTGAVTGNVNFDGSGNVSIATTATSDPTLTINGDASGSATFTNLGNATLTLTVADDSHNHVISNVDGLQAALDGKASASHQHDTLHSTWQTIDLNTIGSDYTLSYEHFSTGSSNMPPIVDNANAVLTANTHTSNYRHQIAFSSTEDLYHRAQQAGTWYSWGKIWTQNNDGSGSGLDADLLDGLDSTSFLRSNADDSFSGLLISTSRNNGISGTYNSTLTDQIWTMGSAYRNAADGSNFGNLYGLAYKHTNNATGGTMAGGHQMVWCQNGTGYAAMGSNIWTSGNVTAYSDIRVKTNLEVIPDAVAKVKALTGYTFDRTDVAYDEDGSPLVPIRQTGVVAQEVLAVLPEAVTGTEETHYSVAYGNLVGLLIEAIKEQQNQIDELKAKLEG